MPARHSKARAFAQSELFAGLKSFEELETRIEKLPTPQERGAAFEVFAEAYLATVRRADFAEIYPQDTAPVGRLKQVGLTSYDLGADGVAISLGPHAECSGYQVKFRSGRTSLTWKDLSTFFGQCDSPLLAHRVLVTNTDTLPEEALRLRHRFYAIRGSDLDKLAQGDFASIAANVASRAGPRQKIGLLVRRPHQIKALAAIKAELAIASRASVVMACGSGKTLVALWAAEQSKARTILVLVPSLALMKQVLGEWLRHNNWRRLAYIAVCSDQTVDAGLDEIRVNVGEFGYPVDTEAAPVREFLSQPFSGVKLVFSTYQSARVVGQAMKRGAAFDLAIFDEAHKTAGSEGRNSAFALEDCNIRITKRLFFTATPRHYNPSKRDSEGSMATVFSMDNPAVYGRAAYTLTFRDAVKAGIIVPYRVIVSVITSAQITKEKLESASVLVGGEEVRARHVANQLALKAAIEKHPARHIFTFHQHVRAAKSFVRDGPEGIIQHLPKFTANHVDGTMSAGTRDGIVKNFKASPLSILSNARCLTEGVNVPGVDMVAFMSPRRSRVDIVQAAGRAMRRAGPEKKVGYILLPLYVELATGETVEAALAGSRYEEIWDVLQALAEQDSVLATLIREATRQDGALGHNEVDFGDLLEVVGVGLDLDGLRKAIDAQIVERLGESWDKMFGTLEAFKQEHGHCNVPATNPDNPRLGFWVSNQRAARRMSMLSRERIRQLEALGFEWDPFSSRWEEMFTALSAFKEANGHCSVPVAYPENPKLGSWASTQRQFHRMSKLTPEHVRRLESLGFKWNLLASQWEQMFTVLKEFQMKNEHCNVPQLYPENPSLGVWAARQRMAFKRDKLTSEQIRRLGTLGFQWTPHVTRWDKMLTTLTMYKKRLGHCNVPRSYLANPSLSVWVNEQRARFRNTELPSELVRRLESLGFDWNPKASQWEIMFAALSAFEGKNGHCRVPRGYSDNPSLGDWVNNQRAACRKNELTPDQAQRLEALGFDLDPHTTQREERFAGLSAFKEKFGHCNVPDGYPENPGLAGWVGNLRQFHRKNKLTPELVRRLEALGFKWSLR